MASSLMSLKIDEIIERQTNIHLLLLLVDGEEDSTNLNVNLIERNVLEVHILI